MKRVLKLTVTNYDDTTFIHYLKLSGSRYIYQIVQDYKGVFVAIVDIPLDEYKTIFG